MASLVIVLVAGSANAQMRAILVESRKIWDGAPHNAFTDLFRFNGRWFCVCREGQGPDSPDGAIRVLTSMDGVKWESATLLKSGRQDSGLTRPKLTVLPHGQLMLMAEGSSSQVMLEPLVWLSKDGRAWDKAKSNLLPNYAFGRVAWHNGRAFIFGFGTICGIAQTIQIGATTDGKRFDWLYEKTFSGFFPKDAAIVFDGDTAFCVMNRIGELNAEKNAYFGMATAPYGEWQWKELDRQISAPNLLRTPDGKIFGAIGLRDMRNRMSICELDLNTGIVAELLELPTRNQIIDVGLVMHDGHLWVSYHAWSNGRTSVHLAKIKLVQG